ncbi:MAG: MOSC domain-containing protein [Candidatus Neomarinimicrobiota bacterium]|nr:MOSC domain-containing protein [Candidatus Neomarinimicrobiota bacterium]
MTGKVLHLHRKPKVEGEFGLQKPEVEQAQITSNGIESDYNDYRTTKKDNHPDMALLLMPVETIRELNKEGWPIEVGDIGENIITEGIAMDTFKPNLKFDIGSAQIQISYECDPCYKLHSLPYVGQDRGPEFVKTMMGRRGWYARVLKAGEVSVGNACEMVE